MGGHGALTIALKNPVRSLYGRLGRAAAICARAPCTSRAVSPLCLLLHVVVQGLYKSASAFAPICNPIQCPWGQKAFTGYLGAADKAQWAEHDATELIKQYDGPDLHLLIDQGDADNFYTQRYVTSQD